MLNFKSNPPSLQPSTLDAIRAHPLLLEALAVVFISESRLHEACRGKNQPPLVCHQGARLYISQCGLFACLRKGKDRDYSRQFIGYLCLRSKTGEF